MVLLSGPRPWPLLFLHALPLLPFQPGHLSDHIHHSLFRAGRLALHKKPDIARIHLHIAKK